MLELLADILGMLFFPAAMIGIVAFAIAYLLGAGAIASTAIGVVAFIGGVAFQAKHDV